MTILLILAAATICLGYGYLIVSVGQRVIGPIDERLSAVDAELAVAERTRR